jgi:hypothetical protein
MGMTEAKKRARKKTRRATEARQAHINVAFLLGLWPCPACRKMVPVRRFTVQLNPNNPEKGDVFFIPLHGGDLTGAGECLGRWV